MAASKELTLVMNQLRSFTTNVVKALVLEVHAKLVRPASSGGTPVDTGFARANWVPSISAPFTAIVGSPEAVSQGAAAQGLAQVATQYMLQNGPAFVSNNVNYITRLNDGSSKKAPAAFVQMAIADAVRAVDRARIAP